MGDEDVAGGSDRDGGQAQRAPVARAAAPRAVLVGACVALLAVLVAPVSRAQPAPTPWADMVASLLWASPGGDRQIPQGSSLSSDGMWTSAAWGELFGDTNAWYGPGVLDRVADTTAGDQPSAGPVLSTSVQGLSATEARVAFATVADDLPGADDDDGCSSNPRCADVFLRDDGLDLTVLVSDGPGTGLTDNHTPALAAEARVVAFTSEGPGLLPADTDAAADVYVAEVDGSGDVTVELVSVVGAGTDGGGPATSTVHAISADGRYVAFTSAEPLGIFDGNATTDVYVRDRVAGTTTLASPRDDGFGAGSAAEGAISDDGRFVAFTTDTTPVAFGTGGRGHRQVYRFDRQELAVALVSGLPGRWYGGDGDSSAPVLDGDGDTVAFTTESWDLVEQAAGPVADDDGLGIPEGLVAHLRDAPPAPSLEPRNLVLEVLAPLRLRGDTTLVSGAVADLAEGRALLDTYQPLDPADVDGVNDAYRVDIADPWCDPVAIGEGPGQFCDDISWVASNGIMGFYPADPFPPQFHPLRPVTRQAMAAITYRLAGSPLGVDPQCTVPPFPDVPTGATFCGEITWMADEGLTTGYPDGTFRPTAPVSRQAMLAFLWRSEGEPATVWCPTDPFPDVPTGHAFCEAIGWGLEAGITTGYLDGTFHTTAPVSRQATAAFVFRLALHRGEA